MIARFCPTTNRPKSSSSSRKVSSYRTRPWSARKSDPGLFGFESDPNWTHASFQKHAFLLSRSRRKARIVQYSLASSAESSRQRGATDGALGKRDLVCGIWRRHVFQLVRLATFVSMCSGRRTSCFDNIWVRIAPKGHVMRSAHNRLRPSRPMDEENVALCTRNRVCANEVRRPFAIFFRL